MNIRKPLCRTSCTPYAGLLLQAFIVRGPCSGPLQVSLIQDCFCHINHWHIHVCAYIYILIFILACYHYSSISMGHLSPSREAAKTPNTNLGICHYSVGSGSPFRLTLSRLVTFRRTFIWRTKHPPEWRWPPVLFIFRRQFIFKVLPKEGLVEIGTFTCVHFILVQGDNESLVQFYVPAHTTMLDPEPWTIRKRYVMFAYPNLGDPSIALLERSHSFVAELMSTEAIARVLHYGFREWIEPQ